MKLFKFKDAKDWQFENIYDISVTKDVSKFPNSNDIKLLQLRNILFVL